MFSSFTIAGNTADSYGGGLFFASLDRMILSSTIIAINDATTGVDVCGGTSTTEEVEAYDCLIGVDADYAHAIPYSNVLNGDPGFATNILGQLLADWGGPTRTIALASNSQCLGVGNNTLGLDFDQRGDGFDREVGDPDIGAFEYGN